MDDVHDHRRSTGESMSNVTPLTESEVSQLVTEWYKKLDVHAPLQELLPLLADDELVMQFPEGPSYKHAGFAQWYERVTHLFFDEVHTMKELRVTPKGDTADVKLVVNWQAHVWNPPDAKSKWLGFDAAQTWVVKRLPQTKDAAIVTYVVDALTPMPGSASL